MIVVLLSCPCHCGTPNMAVISDWKHFSNTRCSVNTSKIIYNPFKWYLIWQKLLFQESLSHRKFVSHPCLLGFKFPKCSLLKSNIHSKVYYTEFNLAENRSQNGHFLSHSGVNDKNWTWRSHLIRLFSFSLSMEMLNLQGTSKVSLSIIYTLGSEGDHNSKTHQGNLFI